MYLVSIYFDEQTEKHVQNLIKKVAEKTENQYMLEGKVPPHITIAAFDSSKPDCVQQKLEEAIQGIEKGTLTWASVSTFLPYVIYLAPVLNEYLQSLSVRINESLRGTEVVRFRGNYQPYNWMPHTTIGKKLTPEEMRIAFEVLQKSFGMFEGEVTKIGLAKTNPYKDIKVWELKEKC